MQTGKSAVATAKEKAENVAASARSGLQKATAMAQEKVEKMRAREPAEKAAAEQHKQARMQTAEMNKQAAMENNAAKREALAGGATTGVVGEHHHSTLGHDTGDTIHMSPVVRECTLTDADDAHGTGGHLD